MVKPERSRKRYDHSACEMLVAPKCDQVGLWCVPHRRWIKWLGRRDQEIVREMDVAWLDPAPDWVLRYGRRDRVRVRAQDLFQ